MKSLFSKNSLWCTHPEWTKREIPRVWFRQKFFVTSENAKIHLAISADNRYILYLDGEIIGRGPCRSDLRHWNYEIYKIPISPGEHVICAKIAQFRDKPQLSEGKELALAESGVGIAFLVAGGIFYGNKILISFDTPGKWLCKEDKSTRNRSHDAEYSLNTFLVSPPEEEVNFEYLEKNVHEFSIDESTWFMPIVLSPAIHSGKLQNPYSRWWLTPREIPAMEEKEELFSRVIKSENLNEDYAQKWIEGSGQLKINGNAKITLDAGVLNTAYPKFSFKGSRGVEIIIRYSEALFVDGKKLVRDDARGSVFGYSDKLILDDFESVFQPFWFRTFRFIELEIRKNEGKVLEIAPPSFITSMYPFRLKADFDCNDCEIRKIWDIAWRTARLCANEHYFDCPYYEQVQYVGDSRIQALISYAITGDGRLGKQAIRHFDWSRLPEGITQSRYPSTWTQVIPGFSLYWVMMIKDYYDYFGDKGLLRELFPGILAVLAWFERRRLKNDLIGHLPYWNFTDWLPEWPEGNPSRGTTEPLTINNLQFAYACDMAAYIADEIGENSIKFKRMSERTISAVNKFCRRKDGVYLDMPGKKFTSQHVNSWAIIANAVNGENAVSLSKKLFFDKSMSKATLYFSFYLFRAWEKTGCSDFFWHHLSLWKQQLNLNLSTFPEAPLNPRSDCHAWSSSPMYEIISTVLGIKPALPGFKEILIAPQISPYGRICGKAPSPFGDISVEIKQNKNLMTISCSMQKSANITLNWPDGKQQKETGKKIFLERKLCF